MKLPYVSLLCQKFSKTLQEETYLILRLWIIYDSTITALSEGLMQSATLVRS